MPTWVQLIVSAAAVVMALGTLWKVVLPGAKLIAEAALMLPVARDLLKQFGDAPGALSVLREIAAQFRTDSGSSLRDVVNRLEATSERIEGRAKTLELRDEEDRTTVARLAAVVNALAARVDLNTRIAEASQVAAVEGRASIQSSVDRLAPTAAATQEPAAPPSPAPDISAPVVATDVHISGVGVGDKLLVQVEDIQPKKEPL